MADRLRHPPDTVTLVCPACESELAALKYAVEGEDRDATSTGPAEHAELVIEFFHCFSCGITERRLSTDDEALLLDEVNDLLAWEAERIEDG
jgi:hypothetical protein